VTYHQGWFDPGMYQISIFRIRLGQIWSDLRPHIWLGPGFCENSVCTL